jgi:hypothetical protein
MHPRDPKHPDHGKWVAKMRKAQKKVWKNMNPAQREARLVAMAQGHGRPTVQLEKTA